MLTVALYGNSLVLGSIGALLQCPARLHVVHVDPASVSAGDFPPATDVLIFDVATALPTAILGLWDRHPRLTLIGIDLQRHQAFVVSGQRASVGTSDDLVGLIEKAVARRTKALREPSRRRSRPIRTGLRPGGSMRKFIGCLFLCGLLAPGIGSIGYAEHVPLPMPGATTSHDAALAPNQEPVLLAPSLTTDRTAYLVGSTVRLAGQGFQPQEVVTLQVVHAGGGAEPDAGHQPFTATADEAGAFTTSWILGDDRVGNSFLVVGHGAASGQVAPVAFRRIAVVRTDKFDYQPGETVVITGAGFRPSEVVTIHVAHSNGLADGAGHLPFEAPADADGKVWAAWFVAFDDSRDSIFRLTATGTASGLVATATFTDELMTFIDDAGTDDEPGQKDLNFLKVDYSPATPDIAVIWGWDDTMWSGNNTGDACTLFDTDADGFANYSLCITVDQSGYYMATRLYACEADNRTDRCAGPTQIMSFLSVGSASIQAVDPFGTTGRTNADCSSVIKGTCLTEDTVANLSVRLADFPGAGAARLLNVCSYPSQEPNSDPSDCVIAPNAGFLTIVKVATPDDDTPFVFTSSAAATNGATSWTINGSGTVSSISFAAGTYDLTEAIPSTWKLDSASCLLRSASPASTGTSPASVPVMGPADAGITGLVIQQGLETVCTFTDSPQVIAIDVDKTSTTTEITAAAQVVPYTFTVTNAGTVTLTGVTVTDPMCDAAPLYVSGDDGDDKLQTTETWIYTCDHTVTQAEIDAGGNLSNTVTADSNESEPDTDTLDIPITLTPTLSIEKVATETSFKAVGDVINYTITVKNTGNTTLAAVTVTDAKVSELTCTPANGSSLAPNESMTCTATHTVTQADIDAGHYANTACVDDGEGGAPEACADENVPGVKNPLLTITKVASEANFDAAGDVLNYTITATNTGNTTLAAVTVTDPLVSGLTCTPANGSSLAPGAVMTCTATHTVTQADIDAGHWANNACADDGDLGAPQVCDDVDVPAVKNPLLTIKKLAAEANYDAVGDILNYTITATNTGNTTLAAVTVSDPQVSGLTCTPANGSSLAPGAEMTCTATHTVTQADIDAGHWANNACVDDGDLGAPQVCDDADVPAVQTPALNVAKTVTSSGPYDSVGDVITYSITVTNTGNQTLTGVAITEAGVGAVLGSCDPAMPATLAPGAVLTCAATHTLTQADIDAGSYRNVATGDSDQTPPDSDDETVPVTQNPALSLDKTAAPLTYDAVGQVIGYSYLVTNSGNVTFAGPVTVNDTKATVTCPAGGLAPGASMTCTASYTIAQGDLDAGSVTNIATASANGTNSNQDSETVTAVQKPALSLDKTGTFDSGADGVANAGELISYEFLVVNTGNVTLHGVIVTDPKVSPISCPADTLMVGASMTCSGTYAVTQADIDAGSVYNLATADSTESEPDTGDNTEPLPQRAAMTLEKSSTTPTITGPGAVEYSYLVTNTGNVSLTAIALTDDKVGVVNCPSTALAVGASMTCTGTHVVTQAEIDRGGDLVNLATADSAQTEPVNDTLSIPIRQNAALTIEKSSTTTSITGPGAVDYGYLVSNTGNVTLTGITVTDDKVALVTCPFTDLAVGASMTCTGTHMVTQVEIDLGGNLVNIATADSAQTDPVTDTVSIPIQQMPAMTIDKSSTTSVISAPAALTYTYLVKNTGNVTLTGITVTDDKVASVSCPFTVLAVGASMTCTGTHVVTQAEIDLGGNLVNIATADSAQTDPVTDTVSIPIQQMPAMSIDKSSTTTTITLQGQVVPYSYLVANTGNVTLTGITVTDDKVLAVSCPKTTLVVGESMTCTGQYTVTVDDTKGLLLTNIATADSAQTAPVSDTVSIPVNKIEGCTPGFWSGGSGGQLWNVANDPDWVTGGASYAQPYSWDTRFFGRTTPFQRGSVSTNQLSNTLTMIQLASSGGTSNAAQKAARSVVAAYLSASFNSAYPLTRESIASMWNAAAAIANAANRDAAFNALAAQLDAYNIGFDCRHY